MFGVLSKFFNVGDGSRGNEAKWMLKQKIIADFTVVTILLVFTLQIVTFSASLSSRKTSAGVVYGAGGVALPGVSVVAQGPEGFGYTTTNGNGQYIITQGLKSGTYNITVEQPGYLIAEKDGVNVNAPYETAGEDLYLNASASISGIVTDNVSGFPIGQIQVVATLSSGGATYFGSATTNLAGTYEINTNIGTGTYNVTAFYPKGHIANTVMVSATAGNRTTHVDLSLQQSGLISGRVTTPSNQPLANITVIAMGLTGGVGYDVTDASGNYSIKTGLGVGNYTVSATSGASSDSKNVSITTDNPVVNNVNFQLTITPSGLITGTVTDADDSKPIVDAHVQATGLNQSNYGDAYTDPTGAFMISSGLDSTDNCTISVSAAGYQDTNITNLPVVVGQLTPNINIHMQKIPEAQSGKISGTITGDSTAVPEFEYPIAIMIITVTTATVAKVLRRKNRLT